MTTLAIASSPETLQAYLLKCADAVEADLRRRLAVRPRTVALAQHGDDPGKLSQAMEYATLDGGKRLRASVVLATFDAISHNDALTSPLALGFASAIEMLHAYTLVHDDLPAMDNDTMRRGKPTVHVAFRQDIAILAGDGLLTYAFATLADAAATMPERACKAVAALAQRSGACELLSGQAIDLTVDKKSLDFATLSELHARKTGALFCAACELGAIAAGAPAEVVATFADFGMAVGLAFQHADDIDDEEFPQFRSQAVATSHQLLTAASAAIAQHCPANHTLLQLASWMEQRLTAAQRFAK